MRNIQEFIFRMKDLGVNINLQNEDLKIIAPKNVLSVEIVNDIKKYKKDIIDFLRNNSNNDINKYYTSLKPVKQKKYYSMSSAQKRIYLLQQMDLKSTVYNISTNVPISSDFDDVKIEKVFHELILRHESLRTSFKVEAEEPVQKIHDNVNFKIEKFQVEKWELPDINEKFIEAFDLGKAPLIRVALIDVKNGDKQLIIDTHHIICDGSSCDILEQEFKQLYKGESLRPLKLQYKDYSEWQNSVVYKNEIQEQKNYWLEKFSGKIPSLNLPTDFLHSNIKHYEGARVSFAFNKTETDNLKLFAWRNDLTIYMSVLSIFKVFLSKLSGQVDVIVGTPTAGRNLADIENLVGMFVNTLAIRTKVEGDKIIKSFLKNLSVNVLEAFENQDYQFDDLIKQLSIERDVNQNPIFDVMFSYVNQNEKYRSSLNYDPDNLVHNKANAKFDLTLYVFQYDDVINFVFEYSTEIYKPETINNFIKYFYNITEQLMKMKEDEYVSDIYLMVNDNVHKTDNKTYINELDDLSF